MAVLTVHIPTDYCSRCLLSLCVFSTDVTFIRWFDEMCVRVLFQRFFSCYELLCDCVGCFLPPDRKAQSVRLEARRFSSPVDLQSGQIHMITISLSELSLSQHNTHSGLQKDMESENRDSLNVRRENVLKEQLWSLIYLFIWRAGYKTNKWLWLSNHSTLITVQHSANTVLVV